MFPITDDPVAPLGERPPHVECGARSARAPTGALPGGAPPGGPVPESDEVLVTGLTTLAAHIAAATCRLLVLLGGFDARGAWAEHGILSAVHWLGWRCGMGAVAAREQVDPTWGADPCRPAEPPTTDPQATTGWPGDCESVETHREDRR
ncbi:hypothetical protein [Georgenia yuyongxinii]